MSRLFRFIKNIEENKFNNISTFVLGLYFVFAFVPFFTNQIPVINSLFVSSGSFATLLRMVGLLLVFIYSFMCAVRCNFKINYKVLFAILFLLLFVAINSIFVKKQYSTTYLDNRMFIEVVFITGSKQMITSLFVTISDLVFMFCLFFILPKNLNIKAIIKYILIPFVIFMLIECFYAVIAQGRSFFNSSDSVQVTGTFPSKNDFGAFLASSFLCCIFIFIYRDKFLSSNFISRKRVALPITLISLMVIFLLFSLIIGCKTAFFSMVLVFVIFYLGMLKSLYYKNNIKTMFVLIIAFLSLCAILICFFAIPSLHSNGLFFKFYSLFTNKLKDSSNESFISRLNVWVLAMSNLNATAHIFGITKGNIMAFTKVSTGLLSSLHNAFLTVYVSYGAVGFAIYAFCSFFILRNALLNGNKSKFGNLIFISLCATSFIFMWSESEMLPFFSCSAIIFIINLLFAVLIALKQQENKCLNDYFEVAI